MKNGRSNFSIRIKESVRDIVRIGLKQIDPYYS